MKFQAVLEIFTLFVYYLCKFNHICSKYGNGCITNSSKAPLPGTNVLRKAIVMGIQADFDGNYSKNASNGATLVFYYLGFTPQELEIYDCPDYIILYISNRWCTPLF